MADIRVVLADDHELVRTGVRRILEDASGITVVAEASSGEQAVKAANAHKPDVVLMDIHMPGIGGIEATRKILRATPTTKVIALTVHGDKPYAVQLLKGGAQGFLTKGCPAEEMIKAIRTVHAGQRYIGTDVAQDLALSLLPGSAESPFDTLSQREMQVLLMLTEGQSIQEISDRLCLSPKTISTYRYRLYDKLGVENDVELIRLAISHGIVESMRVT
ncbi:MAG: UvrY/SirA/GacA family response regulator transcription factor [Gammaproteobacteria bacterium]